MDRERLRILSIIPYKILPAKLGGEKGIAVFNEYLAKKVELTGVTTRNNDPLLAKGYTLLNFLSDNKSRYGNIFLFNNLKRLILQKRITHLITEHPYYGWLAWMLKKATGITWVVHSHNIEYMRSMSIGRWWWKALKWYEGWVYRSADKVFFISDDDKEYAIKNMGVDRSKSFTVTFGIEQNQIPADRENNKKVVRQKHKIDPADKILLFNGALYHSTNYDALSVILDEINPLLLAEKNFNYKIIVCGKGLPEFFNNLEEYASKNVIYAGFVDDISAYFKAADVFLNPILSGGGVKTKAIEAIAMDCTVVSTQLGAMGLKKDVCGKKLIVIQEGEWKLFANLVIQAANEPAHTSQEFFDYYYWERIIERVTNTLSQQHA
jgi:polysaccharide biosynthesis protein PslH